MSFRTEQDQFDKIKWFDSMREGRDLCGSYEFCGECRKESKYPCARAARRWQNGYIRLAVLRAQK